MPQQFPRFKKIELADKTLIESYTANLAPYSDYNFTSLWSWNTKDKTEYSVLNETLIVRFTDYITGEPFFSFAGPTPPKQRILQLLDFINAQGLPPILRLLPEDSVKHLHSSDFTLHEDPDNADYVLSIPELVTYQGRALRGKRNFVNRFRKLYRSTSEKLI